MNETKDKKILDAFRAALAGWEDRDSRLDRVRLEKDARALDPKLIRALRSVPELEQVLFRHQDGAYFFHSDRFYAFLNHKAFYPDSYTSFSQTIGLTDALTQRPITRHEEIVLNFPYKDCLLEGGQTKDDKVQRRERFWNELLAPEEVNRLLTPKVLTNFRRYTTKGNMPVKDIDPLKENWLIKGNNLLVLHTLKQRFAEQVKLVYIDPPYNTGNDSFTYNDSFSHSSWLVFMKDRLQIARDLLRTDGVVFVQCDDNEQAYLKVLMDEIFGRENFVGIITAQTNPRGRSLDKHIAKTYEYIIIHARNANNKCIKKVKKSDKSISEYNKKDTIGKYREMRLMNGNRFFTKETRPNLWYPLFVNPNTHEVSLTMDSHFCVKVLPINSNKNQQCWTWGKEKVEREKDLLLGRKSLNGTWRIYRKDYLNEESSLTKEKSLWVNKEINHENGTEHLRELNLTFSYSKSEHLLQRVISLSTDPNDPCPRFFCR